jgi:AcrR family transcriptional regulator
LIDNILNSALKILTAKRYEDATIADISKAADIGRGILHYYFSNKEDLVSKALTEL